MVSWKEMHKMFIDSNQIFDDLWWIVKLPCIPKKMFLKSEISNNFYAWSDVVIYWGSQQWGPHKINEIFSQFKIS